MPNPAAVAYEAYRQYWNCHGVTNNTYLVPWDCVSDAEKEAWWSVVRSLFSAKELERMQ